MPGPPPKNPATRARTNQKSTAAMIEYDPEAEVPDLPTEVLHPVTGDVTRTIVWHPMARAEWEDIWKSGIGEVVGDVDKHGLFKYVLLVNDFYFADDPATRKELSGEIRLIRREFGLTPLARASLQWTIVNTAEAMDKREARVRARESGQPLPSTTGADPRKALFE